LSFAGTVGNRNAQPQERLVDIAAFKRWLEAASLVPARTRLVVTQGQYDDALLLREAIASIAAAITTRRKPEFSDIQHLNDAVKRWHTSPRLDPETLALHVLSPEFEAEAALGRIAVDAVELFSSQGSSLLRRCELDSCGAVFVDSGHGRPRKWCSMERCGNRAKVRAFRKRQAGL